MAYHTSALYLKNLKQLFYTMLTANIILSLIIVLVSKKFDVEVNKTVHQIIQWILPIALIFSFLGSAYVFKKKLDIILQLSNTTLKQKLEAYKTAIGIRWSLFSFPIASIMYFFTDSYYYLIVIFIALVILYMYAPSKEQVIAHLQLNAEDKAVLEDAYAVL